MNRTVAEACNDGQGHERGGRILNRGARGQIDGAAETLLIERRPRDSDEPGEREEQSAQLQTREIELVPEDQCYAREAEREAQPLARTHMLAKPCTDDRG